MPAKEVRLWVSAIAVLAVVAVSAAASNNATLKWSDNNSTLAVHDIFVVRDRVYATFQYNSEYGAELRGGFANDSIARNNNAGFRTMGGSPVIVRGTIEDSDVGVHVYASYSGGRVRDNVFDNCSTVAYDDITGCSAPFECDVVRNCGKGIRIAGPVTGNIFENNKGPAITMLSQMGAHNNSFINNGPVDVLQSTSAQCDFSCNYWGTTNADEVAARIVDFASNPSPGAVVLMKTKKANCIGELSFSPKVAPELRHVRLYLSGALLECNINNKGLSWIFIVVEILCVVAGTYVVLGGAAAESEENVDVALHCCVITLLGIALCWVCVCVAPP